MDEYYAKLYSNLHETDIVGMRYFNIFGPRQSPKGAYAAAIPLFILSAINGGMVKVFGDGSQTRDFTFVENAVQANILGLTTENKECFGEAMNIGAGGQTSLLELIEVLKKELDVDIDPIFGPERPGDIPHSNADISKAQNMLGYDPIISFEMGMKKYVEFVTFFLAPRNLLAFERADGNGIGTA